MTDYGSLLTLRDVHVAGPEAVLQQLGDKLEARLPAEVWERNKRKEADWDDLVGAGDRAFVFVRKDDLVYPRASLFLVAAGQGADITNIVPLDVQELTRWQYNGILEDFLAAGLRPVADELGLKVETSEAVQPITTWLSEPAAKKLLGFSRLANHSTGSSHPKDLERWLAFIIQAHRDAGSLDAGTLERWLIEVEGWSPDKASELAIEYEFGRELLKQFSESRD